jgi:DNA-binding MarR family transcriptional regulator
VVESAMQTVHQDRMAAWVTLLQAHAAVVAALGEKLEKERGLPLSWHEVLVHLAAAPEGKLRMQDLARSVLLSKSGVTRLVDRMEEAGLVERAACASDRRVIYTAITDRGRSDLNGALPVFVEGFDEHFARFLSDGDAKALRSSLRKVLAGHGQEQAPTCPSAYLEEVPARTG